MKKTCTKCLIEKDLEEFYAHKTGKNGRASVCKHCHSIRAKKYRENNKEKITADKAKYYKDNKEEINKKNSEWNVENREAIALRSAKYRQENREKISVNKAKYYQDNKGKHKKWRANWNKNNKEEIIAWKARWQQENKKELAAKKKIYYQKHKEMICAKARHYRENNKAEILVMNNSPSVAKNLVIPSCDNPLLTEEGWTVECKMCGNSFLPSKQQIQNRIQAYKNINYGGKNFYCSDNCRESCPVFGFNTKGIDPRSKLFIPNTDRKEARACQTDHLKQLQCDEVGHNYCEKCGDIIDVDLHHTQPVGAENSISSAGHMLLCAGCHMDLHAICP